MRMQYLILCDGEVIGTSMLEHRDAGMGTASGKFEPAPAYAKVRAVFRLFSEAQQDTGPADSDILSRYYAARDELSLSVETAAGEPVSTEVVHVTDFAEEFGDDAYEVEVHVNEARFFEQ